MIRIFTDVPLIAALACLPLAGTVDSARAQQEPTFELHDWSVWLADPTLEHVNAKDHFTSAMPGVVDSTRFRTGGRAANQPQPLGMMTFYGDALDDIEVDLRVEDGRFMAHWPPSRAKSNRLSWIETSLAAELEDATQLAYVSPEHWFHQAREGEALFVRRGGRTDRFIAYDAEFEFTVPIKLTGGPDVYRVQNLNDATLEDLVICLPTPEGRRIGWLNKLAAGAPAKPDASAKPAENPQPATQPPAAQPAPAADLQRADAAVAPVAANDFVTLVEVNAVVDPDAAASRPAESENAQPAAAPAVESPGPEAEVVMSPPLADDDPRLVELTRAALSERLLATGLHQQEVDLIMARYGEAMFESDSMVVLFRHGEAAVDERMPLVTYPDPVRSVRLALVMVRNIDPQIGADIRDLVTQLGDAKYAQREGAQQRLAELGRLAIPALKAALTNSDPEIVYRAERLLLAQNESID